MTSLALELVRLLVDVARAIGRWAVRRLVDLGVKRGIPWMDRKIATFTRRRQRALERDKPKRARWLAGKIRRWTWARAQVEGRRAELGGRAVRAYCRATDTALSRVPWYASAERCPAEVRAEG